MPISSLEDSSVGADLRLSILCEEPCGISTKRLRKEKEEKRREYFPIVVEIFNLRFERHRKLLFCLSATDTVMAGGPIASDAS